MCFTFNCWNHIVILCVYASCKTYNEQFNCNLKLSWFFSPKHEKVIISFSKTAFQCYMYTPFAARNSNRLGNSWGGGVHKNRHTLSWIKFRADWNAKLESLRNWFLLGDICFVFQRCMCLRSSILYTVECICSILSENEHPEYFKFYQARSKARPLSFWSTIIEVWNQLLTARIELMMNTDHVLCSSWNLFHV